MRSIRILTTIAFVSALAFSGAAARAQDPSTDDPVADAARKAREEKKNAPKPKKVFTDDDVPSKTAEQPAPAAAPAAGADNATASSDKPLNAKAPASKDEDPNSEKAWRKRFAEQHRKIGDAEQELDVLQREAQVANVQYYSDPQKALQEQYSRDEINKKNAAIDAKKKELADLKQQLSDLEDQLRSSGGDPAWAR
jgi:hypothetical protein